MCGVSSSQTSTHKARKRGGPARRASHQRAIAQQTTAVETHGDPGDSDHLYADQNSEDQRQRAP